MSWCFLRQATVPILLIPSTALYNHPTWRDGSFCWIWWVALGWAAEIFGIKQGYDGLALYRDVLVNARKTVMTSNQIGRPQNGLILDYGSVAPENPETTPSFTQSIDIKRRPLYRSRTPKCINVDGITLSAKIGLSCVEGIGNGGGEIDPKRILMAWMRKSAFLKQ